MKPNYRQPKGYCWLAYFINEFNYVSVIGLWKYEGTARHDILELCPDVDFDRCSENCYSFSYKGYSALLVCHNVY